MDAQFTEDEIAKARHPCERSACNTIIEVGESRYYVGNMNTAGLGKMVCGACYKHYNQKLSTTVRECSSSEPIFVPVVVLLCHWPALRLACDIENFAGSSSQMTSRYSQIRTDPRDRLDIEGVRNSVNSSQRKDGQLSIVAYYRTSK